MILSSDNIRGHVMNTQISFQLANQAKQITEQIIQQTQQGSQQYSMMLQQVQQNVQLLEQILQREKQAVHIIEQSLHNHELAIQRCQEVAHICNQMQNGLTGTNTIGFQAPIQQSYNPGQISPQFMNQTQFQPNHLNSH